MKKIKPITPEKLTNKKIKEIPDEVIQIFNDLITENFNGTSANVSQKIAATRIAQSLDISIEEVYNRNLLDVEDIFSKAGWLVFYDKPGYNENYPATFDFRKKK